MPHPALRIEGLRASLDPEALLQRRLRLEVEGGTLRLSAAGLQLLLPPGTPVQVQRISGGKLVLFGTFKGFHGTLELRPSVSPTGNARLTVEAARAGFLPLPAFVVSSALRFLLPVRPGLRVTDEGFVEIDLAEPLRRVGVELPRLRSVRVDEGLIQLGF